MKNQNIRIVETANSLQRTEVVVKRTILLPVGRKGIGISCRTDDAEPWCVIVNQVLPGSPAFRAGLKVNDRILKAAGSLFNSIEQFESIVGRNGDSVKLEIEREGHRHPVVISLHAPREASPAPPH